MKRTWTTRFLALVFLLSSTLGATSSAAWYCEGRMCGASRWECCCSSGSDGCDLPSAIRPHASHTASAGCRTACSCVMVEKPIDQNVASRCASLPLDVPAADLPVQAVEIDEADDGRELALETRGPPVRRDPAVPLGLRAPPAA